MPHRFNSLSQLPLGMKMAETLFGLLRICCSGYRHPPEAMNEAEGFFLPNATLVCKVTSGMGQSLNS